ncbi:unnamed protein product [Rangifer tarandus platyrhynchus]|uniref:Uncharacterized protein n=2 Tax=Rangifer tarandus platyrhynchus TaxID=3082113 RepID=A0ACB0ESB5_RANTA|nr:unnamed protein product [Rangifer tarandus platyrhynchus]CAI9703682.1 unnamed protein product [Rangifer tarandus platyrhynchus]
MRAGGASRALTRGQARAELRGPAPGRLDQASGASRAADERAGAGGAPASCARPAGSGLWSLAVAVRSDHARAGATRNRDPPRPSPAPRPFAPRAPGLSARAGGEGGGRRPEPLVGCPRFPFPCAAAKSRREVTELREQALLAGAASSPRLSSRGRAQPSI